MNAFFRLPELYLFEYYYGLEILWTGEFSQYQKHFFCNEILLRMKILCAMARGKIKTWRNNNYRGYF